MKTTILLSLALALLSGCSSTDSFGPSSELKGVMSITKKYEVPPASISCTVNGDAELNELLNGIYDMGILRGFVIDGTHADEGVLVFSKQGRYAPVTVLVLGVRDKDTGVLLLEHSTNYLEADTDIAVPYTNTVVGFLGGN